MVHKGGKGGQKSPKFCPHGLWMTPNVITQPRLYSKTDTICPSIFKTKVFGDICFWRTWGTFMKWIRWSFNTLSTTLYFAALYFPVLIHIKNLQFYFHLQKSPFLSESVFAPIIPKYFAQWAWIFNEVFFSVTILLIMQIQSGTRREIQMGRTSK